MSQFSEIIKALRELDTKSKNGLLQYLLKSVQGTRVISNGDKELIGTYCTEQITYLLDAIPKAKSYREKDELFQAEDTILGIFITLYNNPNNVPDDIRQSINELVTLCDAEQVMENMVNKVFAEEKIEEAYIDRLISLLTSLTDEYQRAKFYSGLIHHQNSIKNLTPEAEKKLSSYICSEQKRYLEMKELSRDCLEGLEFSADACKYLFTEKIAENLYAILELSQNKISYYAVETLLSHGKNIPKSTVFALANDLVHAEITYSLLQRYNKTDLFPKELSDPVYLAKSDLVHWLTYPTELGKAPDSIEYIGRIKKLFRSEVFHVFKYISNSDNLDEESKNKWLIGWSSNEGGTFSNFDKYDDYDLGSVEKTLKNIKKKLIG